MTISDETQRSIDAAAHLDREGKDAGAIAALLAAARKLDDWDRVLDAYFEQLEMDPESTVRPPAQDNATLGHYLKYCEALGLTPAARGELASGKKSPGGPKDELAAFKQKHGIA